MIPKFSKVPNPKTDALISYDTGEAADSCIPQPKEDPAAEVASPSNEAVELRETVPQAISSPPRWGSRDFLCRAEFV